MGRTSRQTWQIVNQNPLTVLETNSRERLDNLNTIIDSKLDYPFRVTLAESLLTIRSSEIQTIKSDGNDGFENGFKISSSPIQGLYKKIPQSSINFFTGETTGPFAEINDAPDMDPNNYVWAGIELREDGKFYLYWGEQSSTIEGATYPLFKTGDSICLVLLRGFTTGGLWKFNNPNPEDIILFKESNALEIREDVVHKARVIDLVSQALPTGSSIVIDGESILENDLVLFTKSAIEGLYRAKFVEGDVFWEKILQPISGSNVQVTGGTLYLRTIWKRVQGIWAPLEIAEAVKEPTGFPNRTDSTFSFDNSTRTFTLSPVSDYFDYFIKGNVWRVDGPISITIPNTVGDHFLYLDGNINISTGNYLHSLTTFDNYLLTEKAYVAYIYWSGTEAIILGDERHGLSMSGATHRYLHLSVGTVLQSGLDLGLFTEEGTGNLNSDAQITMANALLFDEDIDIRIVHNSEPQDFFDLENPDPTKFHEQILTKSFEPDGVTVKHPSAKIPVYYKVGEDGHWEKDSATYYPFKLDGATGLMSLNKFNSVSGEWETISATNENYVTTWVFATNSVSEPIIAIMGQYQYETLSEAQEKETFQELNTQNFPVKEFKLCYRLIFQTDSAFGNDVKTALRHAQDLRISPDTPFASVSVKDHGLLTGLEDPDHAPTAVTTAGVVKDGGLSASDIDAKNVFDTINKLFGQLRILEHPTNKNRVRITGADRVLNNNTKLSQAIGSLLLSFEGAEIDFALNKVIYADISRPDVDFSRPTISNNFYHWFSISLATNVLESNNTLSGQILIIPASEANIDIDVAPKAVFSAGLKLGQVVLKGAGGFSINNILQENIIQLGVGSGGGGGDGTGDANELLERLKNIFDKSEYEFLTPNIFSISGDDEIDSATAEFSIVSSNYVFKQIGDEIVSTDILDNEYTSQDVGTLKDINNIDFYAYYDINNFDENAVFEVSRSDGAAGTWQTFSPTRIGNSDTYYSSYTFQEENVFPLTITAQSGGVPETFNFEGNVDSIYFREFSVDSPSVIKKINTSIGINSSPLGRLSCKIVKNVTGTNLIRYSEDFQNSNWIKTRSSILQNIEQAPDGTFTADKLVENTDNNSHLVASSVVNITTRNPYTTSVYVKKSERSICRLRLRTTENIGSAVFNLDTGVVVSGSGTIASVPGATGWYRISVTGTATISSTSGRLEVFLYNNIGNESYTGDNVSGLFIWGAKVEVGSTLTTYSATPLLFTGRSSIGSFLGSDGLLRYATTDIARNNYTSSNLNLPPKLLLEEARTNILQYTEDFDNAYWTKNRVSILKNFTTAPDGTLTASKMIETTGTGVHDVFRASTLSYTAGNLYTSSVFAKAAERNFVALNFSDGLVIGGGEAEFDLSTGNIVSVSVDSTARIEDFGNGWYRCSVTATCDVTGTGNGGEVYIRETSGVASYTGDGISGIYIWGLQQEEGSYPTSYIPSSLTFTSRSSTGTFVGINGFIQNASLNTARINYNPSNLSIPPKLLLEESRSNLALYSQDFSDAYWTKTRSSISSNVVISPDGTLTGDKIVEDTSSSNTHLVSRSFSYTTGTTYTFSVFAKADERECFSINLQDTDFGSNSYASFDLKNGIVLTTGTGLGYPIRSIVKYPDGWYRCSLTLTAITTASSSVTFNLSDTLTDNSNKSYTGNGVSGLYVWGAQVEVGSFATSYIPTTTLSVTRSEDISSSSAATRSEDLSSSNPEVLFSNPNDLVSYSNSINLSGLAAGSKTFDITAVLSEGSYFIVFETDDLYKSNYNLSSGTSRISGALDSGQGIRCVLNGRNLSLKLKITGGTENASLRGYGVLYNLLTKASKYSEGFQEFKVSFNGYTQNLNEFTLPFIPEKRLLKVYEQNTGQVYKHGVFAISGNKIIFPANTFYKPEEVILIFEQLNIVNFSLPLTTDKAYALMVENNLGSTNPNLDASANGRGIFLRRPDGTLREITIDNDDNIVIYSV